MEEILSRGEVFDEMLFSGSSQILRCLLVSLCYKAAFSGCGWGIFCIEMNVLKDLISFFFFFFFSGSRNLNFVVK